MTKRFGFRGSEMTCPDCGEAIWHGDPVSIVGDLVDRHICCDACAEVHDDEEPDV